MQLRNKTDMEANYWLVIDTLVDYIKQGRDEKNLREAHFKLLCALDDRLVGKSIDELKPLVAVLNGLLNENLSE